MAGSPITIISTVTLPAQPPVGSTTYIPLGGDGYSAPHAAYAVKGFSLAHDASGGNAHIGVTMDNRFCSLVSYCTGAIKQITSADAGMSFELLGPTIATVALVGPVAAVISLVDTQEVRKTWEVPPLVLPGGSEVGTLSLQVENVLNDSSLIDVLIYLFNIRVRELTPMGPILWARGSR